MVSYGESSRTEVVRNHGYGRKYATDGWNDYFPNTYEVEHGYRPTPASGVSSDGWLYPTGYFRSGAKINSNRPAHLTTTSYENYSNVEIYNLRGANNYGSPFSAEVAAEFGNAADRCNNQALNGLRGEGRTQSGADLGEAKQTLHMIADAVVPLIKAVKAAKSGNYGVIPRLLGMNKRDVLSGRFAANKWLEYQYGWKPLMSSIYDAQSRLAAGLRDKIAFEYASSRVSQSFSRSYTVTGDYYGQLEKIDYKAETKIEVKYIFVVRNHTIDLIDGLGLLNPLEVAWELTPFSFVADWFVPIGNTLSAITASAGLEYKSGYMSRLDKETFHSRLVAPESPNPTWKLQDGGATEVEKFQFTRIPYSTFQAPRLYANPNPFSTPHVLNALALIRQML